MLDPPLLGVARDDGTRVVAEPLAVSFDVVVVVGHDHQVLVGRAVGHVVLGPNSRTR